MLPVRRRDEPARVNWCLSFCIWRWGSFPLLLFFCGNGACSNVSWFACVNHSARQSVFVCNILYAHIYIYVSSTQTIHCFALSLNCVCGLLDSSSQCKTVWVGYMRFVKNGQRFTWNKFKLLISLAASVFRTQQSNILCNFSYLNLLLRYEGQLPLNCTRLS